MTAPRAYAHDFDAFLASQAPPEDRELALILGVEVVVPSGDDLPASMLFKDIGDLENPDAKAVREVAIALFGADALDQWFAQGISMRKMMVIVGWGMAQAQGSNITFTEADERLRKELERLKSGAPTPQQARLNEMSAAAGAATLTDPDAAAHAEAVRAAGKALSSGTGPPSKPTSDASTTSGRPSSPAWGSASSAPFYGG